MQYYDQDSEYRQQGVSFAPNYQKQANFFNQQQQQQQQKQQQQSNQQNEKLIQYQLESQQQQQQQIISQQQLQIQQQQQQLAGKLDDQKQNQDSDDEDKQKQSLEFIKELERQLYKYFQFLEAQKRKPNEEEIDWIMEVSLNLSIEYKDIGDSYLKQKRNKDADKWLMRSLQYTEPKEIMDEPIIGPNGEKLNRRENCRLEWYLLRISIANSLYALFKRRNKTTKIIEIIKSIVAECENCQLKIKIQEHLQSNIENLYYHLAEYSLIRMQLTQPINQKPSQQFLSGTQANSNSNGAAQPSLTNINQQQQANLLLQKAEIEETMRYAKLCMNILSMKYRNISNKKVGDVFIIDSVSKVFLEKKQIMFIHVMYLIGRTLQWGEFYTESLSFYRQAYFLARSHFRKRGIHPVDGKDDLLTQYKQKIEQVCKIIQNDVDENMSPEQFDKVFRDDLEIMQVGIEDQGKQSKTLSLNFDAIQPYTLITDGNDLLEGLAPSHAKLKSQGLGDEDNLNFFNDESLVVSQILLQTDQQGQKTQTDKSKKSSNRLNTKDQLGKSTRQKSQQMMLNKNQKNSNLNEKKQMTSQQMSQAYPQIRKSSLNLITKESIQLMRPQSSQNQMFQANNKNDMFQRKLSRQKTTKVIGYIDQEIEITQHLLENRNIKRNQGQNNILELAEKIQANYNNFVEYRKELNDFFPQLPSNQSVQDPSIQQQSNQQFSQQQQMQSQQQYLQIQVQNQNFFEQDKKSSGLQLEQTNQNSQQSYDQYYAKGMGSKGFGIQGLSSPNNLNTMIHSQQQQIQSSFNISTSKKLQRPLTSNTQLSTYRPQSSTRNLNLRILQDDNDNIIELGDQANGSGIYSSRYNQFPNQNTPKSPSYLINSLYKYELLVRPSENKQGQNSTKKPFQIKKAQYQIKIAQKNTYTNNSYHTINEQGDEYQKLVSGTQTPLRQSPIRLKSMHVQNQQNRLSSQNQKAKQRPQTSMAYVNQGYQNKNNQDSISHFDSNSQIQIPSEIAQPKKRTSIFNQFNKQQQAQQSHTELKNTDDLNLQIKQINTLQKHKNSYEIFDDDGPFNFVQGFDLDKVISQRFERLIAEEGERNLKDRENSLQKLEYIGPDNKNLSQNQPTLQNDDDLYSEDGDREGALQDDKQQQDNLNNNNNNEKNQNNLQPAGADQGEKGMPTESEKMTKEKEEMRKYIKKIPFPYEIKESRRIEEIYSLFKKVKQCKDRFIVFYQKFNHSAACLWKLEKFKIKFKVYESNKDVTSLANFNFKNKESTYKFVLTMHLESFFYTGKLQFIIQKTDIEFLETFLYKNNIISRWGIADFILNEYFGLPKNLQLLLNFKQFYKQQVEQSQLILSFDHTIGSYQGQFQNQVKSFSQTKQSQKSENHSQIQKKENNEVINIGYKLQFLLGQQLKLVKTPTGEKLKFIQQIGNVSQTVGTLNQISQISQVNEYQSDGFDGDENEQYERNYLYLKEFLKVRRQIVRRTIINLETLAPQIFIKFGIQKKMKPYVSPNSSPTHSIDQINEPYNNDIAQQYKMIEEYVEEYKKYLQDNAIIYERSLFLSEDIANKGQQQSNSPHLTKQFEFELMNQRTRQKTSIPNLNSIGIKAQKSFRNNQFQLQSPPSNVNMIQSYNVAPSSNPLVTTSRIPYQQNSPNSSIDNNVRQFQSRANSIAQLPELQPTKYSGEIDNQDDIYSPNEVNCSIDSQQRQSQSNHYIKSLQLIFVKLSRLSINKGNQAGSGSNSNSQGKEDSRQGMSFIRQDTLRRGEREGSKTDLKNVLEDDQQPNQIISPSSMGQNPTIERFFQRNINKKSTFSMIKRNEQSEKENSENMNQQEDNLQQDDDFGVDRQRNESIGFLPQVNQKDSDDTSRGKQRIESNDFDFQPKNSQMIEKLSSSNEMVSFEETYRRMSVAQPEEIIENFKYDLNLSVSQRSSEPDSEDQENFDVDREEESILNKETNYKIRQLTHSKSSVESSQPLMDYPNQKIDSINQNIGSHDQRAMQKNKFIIDDKMVLSERMSSPRSFTDENAIIDNTYSKQMTLRLQQQQESSLDAYQKEYVRKRSDEQQNEFDYEASKLIFQDGPPILPFQQEYIMTRMREDSKSLQPGNENMNSTQNEYNQSQILRVTNQQGSNTTIEDVIKLKVENFKAILQRQIKIRFCTPLKYIQYFEENRNISQIAIPNIFINAFRQKDVLLSGLMRLSSMSLEEFTRRKEGGSENIKNEIKTISKMDDEDEEDVSTVPNKYQSQSRQIILDNNEKVNFFVTIQISYTQNAQTEWNIETLKKDVLIHVEAIQLQSDNSQDSKSTTSRYSSTFTFYEFIENLFTEDNDLLIQDYYETIQRLLKRAAGSNSEEKSPSNLRINLNEEDSFLQEEQFGLNVETLQYEGLNPFIDFNIKFQKAVCNHKFKLNKFIYNIGFTKIQKRLLIERLNSQMIIVEKQLKLLPKKIKRFRLFQEKLYFVDDGSYHQIVQKHLEQKIILQQQIAAQFKKLTLNSPTNVNLATIQQLATNVSLYYTQNKMKMNKLEGEEQKSEDNQEKQSDSYQDQTGDKKKIGDPNDSKPLVSNIKLSPMNSLDIDIDDQMRNQYYEDFIQDIIVQEKIFHLYQIISRESVHSFEYLWVLTKKQFEERQMLIQQQQLQQQQKELQLQNQQQQQQQQPSQDLIEQSQDSSRTHIRIASFSLQSDINFRRESHLINHKSPQNSLQNQTVSQELQLQNKRGRKQSLSTQKAAYQFKKQIRSDPKNKIFEVQNEERDRYYNDGRINHPYAMMYYNSILRVEEDQKKRKQKELQKRKWEERNILDHRESFRREEDLKIIDNLQSNKDGFRKKIKVEYQIDKDQELNAKISFYDPLSYRVETVRVKERKNLEKLQNLLQVNNSLLNNQKLRNILVKMNMKWNRKIIGRKLEFRSFIETNEEFFNYKLNRKMNPNDEALYKLMTTRHYLDENKEQFTNFLYKVKLALISNDQNAETAEQNYFFNTYFYSTSVQQFQNITNLGRALIQTTVYQSKLLYTTDNYVFIRIDITPAAKRTKLIKMILDYNDINTIFSKTKYNLKNCLDPGAITKMIMEFAEKVNYSHTQNYNALKIPFWKQFNQISESSDYDLVNQFDFNSMNTKQEISFLSKKSMLTPVLRTLKIIYQGIKKINGEFLVITVKRYIYLNIDWFQLIIYIPNTCRRFICYLMESDMLKFDPEFMEQVIPLVIVKHESNINELIQSKNYLQFCETFDKMHKKLIQQDTVDLQRKSEKKITLKSQHFKSIEEINSNQSLKMKMKNSMMNLNRFENPYNVDNRNAYNNSLQQIESIHDFKEFSLNQSQLKMHTNQTSSSKYAAQRVNFVKFFQKNLTEQTSFLEKKVWEHLISGIIIEENQQHKLVLKINTFSGILRETLSSMVLNMNERDNILYEFYIEEYKRKTIHSIFSKSTSLMLSESFNQNLYIRIHFFGQDIVHNQKVCGRHMLFSFHKQSRSKLKNTTIKDPSYNRESSSQVRINLSQTKIGSGDSYTKIPSHPKIQNTSQQPKPSLRQRTSIIQKSGLLVINPQSNQKKSQDNRVSIANAQKIKQEQQLVAAEDDPFLYSFRLNNMQDMSIFYANKIKANYNKFVKEREKKQLKGKIQDYLSLYKSKSLEKDNYCKAILRANKNFKRHKDIDPQKVNQYTKYFIIYRRILTLSPRQMIAIFYKPNKNTFYMYIWNNINSKDVIIKKKLKEIEKFIPHATQFLSSKLYKELGDRIFLCFKNQILLQTYETLKLD